MKYNLLNEALIETDSGRYTLPGLLAAMAGHHNIARFPRLRAHQRPAWHMFLTQLGVLALDSVGERSLPESKETWLDALRSLTANHDDDAPWHLVVEDGNKPAFLQPSDPGDLKWKEKDVGRYQKEAIVRIPEDLDMLVSARNHGLVRNGRDAEPQDWMFALISGQTMDGYGGKSNYGIVRMMSGESSRAMLTLAPAMEGSAEIDPAAWWRRDVRILLDGRGDKPRGEKKLLWLEPWPEGERIEFDVKKILDPLFIEICRRIRLREINGKMDAIGAGSIASRIDGNVLNGMTEDPWAPVRRVENDKKLLTSLTLGKRDWNYIILNELMFSGKWKRPLLLEPTESETGTMLIVAETIGRTKKTHGFRSRVIPTPKKVVKEIFAAGEKRVSDFARKQIEDIKDVVGLLRKSLLLVAAKGIAQNIDPKKHGKFVTPACAALDRHADEGFFQELWKRMDAGTDGEKMAKVRFEFMVGLSEKAWEEFEAALSSLPGTRMSKAYAEHSGRARLMAGLKKLREPVATR